MKQLLNNIYGDKAIWALVVLLAIFSFLPVYSASSNLVYVVGNGSVVGHILKHIVIVVVGMTIMFGIHRMPFRYFKGLSIMLLPVVLLLLLYTALQGSTIGGANASRWIRIPLMGITFQPSTLAMVVLMIYISGYLSKKREQIIRFGESILPLWLPVFLIVGLVLPSNFSTAAMMFLMVLVLAFLGGYPLKYLAGILVAGMIGLTLFVLLAKAYPEAMPNRVDTWMSRLDSFYNGGTLDSDYQIERAKTAIVSGGLVGVGAGKSVMKNLLPQSTSDFIYAIIAEEYGLLGALSLLFFYLLLLFRIVVVAHKAETPFGKLLVMGVGLPIVFQALVNMAVAVELFPVTGQPLPLISSGGTSIWMTFLALGIVLSVSANRSPKPIMNDENDNPLAVLSETL
ncbi:MAG: FtsW/RodA/SpoVE family cell cycle protein [Flavobacteriaceae bacterium]|nr:FtsW/RodA/SpoVE family cell cycle protein [Flavobacteriaceae bacterium]MDG2314096.1 FtsW/RodA/SpoVE family cell cycle protein [Flavobacteriaceae bacterium]